MGKKYWLALANLIWLGCWPAAMVQASEGQVVVSNAAMQHDWYQNSTAEQARRELELQLQEAVLAQLHPDFYTLWKKLQAKPADQRGAVVGEVGDHGSTHSMLVPSQRFPRHRVRPSVSRVGVRH